jgi:hypothetical protein
VREDMAKVIVERPRCKCGTWRRPKGEKRRRQRLGEEGLPGREGIRRPWLNGAKHFNEHLGPLRRYIDSQVGRPWDKVFSEICAHLKRDSVVQDHVRDHVEEYVVTDVVVIDGVACHGGKDRRYGTPLSASRGWGWYVCPRTRLLRRQERWVRPATRPKVADRVVPVSETQQCRFRDGAWHLVTLVPLPAARERCSERDVVLNAPVANLTPPEARRHYGAEVYASRIRRLSRRELTQYPIPMAQWG